MKIERMGEIFGMTEAAVMAEYHKIFGGVLSEGNFLWVPSPQTNFILQAHADTVSKGSFQFELRVRRMILDNGFVDILGGDDRCGILAIEEIYKRNKSKKKSIPSILLTCGEESGSHGMKAFIEYLKNLKLDERMALFSHVHLFLALDRKGFGEFVCYNNIPDEHKGYLESYGFEKGFGSYSDIKLLTEYTYIPHANLAIGYYNNHSKNEYMVLDEWAATINRVLLMLEDPPVRKHLTKETLNSWSYKWQREDEENYGNYNYGVYNSHNHTHKKGGKYWKYFKNRDEQKKKDDEAALERLRQDIAQRNQDKDGNANKDKAVVVNMPQSGGIKGLSQSKSDTRVKDILKNSCPASVRDEDAYCSACSLKSQSLGFFSDVTDEHSAGQYWLCKDCATTYAAEMLPFGTEYVYGFEKTDPSFHEFLSAMLIKYMNEQKRKQEASVE